MGNQTTLRRIVRLEVQCENAVLPLFRAYCRARNRLTLGEICTIEDVLDGVAAPDEQAAVQARFCQLCDDEGVGDIEQRLKRRYGSSLVESAFDRLWARFARAIQGKEDLDSDEQLYVGQELVSRLYDTCGIEDRQRMHNATDAQRSTVYRALAEKYGF
jgi:hypothetical protein